MPDTSTPSCRKKQIMNTKTNAHTQRPVVALPVPRSVIPTLESCDVIPVGQEPRQADLRDDSANQPARTGGVGGHRNDNKSYGTPIRNPAGLDRYRNALQEVQAFRRETMQHLRRAEICVWLAIHGCQGKEGACISQERIAELSGTTGKRHVRDAIADLCSMGLLEVLETGRYRPNGSDGHGLASIYRAYPRPEPRLARRPLKKGAKRSSTKAPADTSDRGVEKRKAK